MSCRTCKFLDVKPDADGRARIRKQNVYPCTVVVPLPNLPDSVRMAYHFSWPPTRRVMQPDEGVSCHCYEKI